MLVEFANVAIVISPYLWYEIAVHDLLGYGIAVAMLKGMVIIRLYTRAKERDLNNMIGSRLAVMTVKALQHFLENGRFKS